MLFSGHHPYRRLVPVLALIAMAFSGCQDEEPAIDPSAPSLTIVGSNACGRNILPTTRPENIVNGPHVTLALVATGIDPSTASREMVEGTVVEFVINNTDENTAFFVNRSDDAFVSGPSPITGRTARGEIFCSGIGQVQVNARITNYRPNGTGAPITVTSLRPFPIRCVTEQEYAEACGLTPPDVEVDAVVEDAGPDTGDAVVEDGELQHPWTVRYINAESDEDLVLSVRGSAGTRPDNVVIKFVVMEGDHALSDVPVLVELTGADGVNNGYPGEVSLRAEPEAIGIREEIQGDNDYADLYRDLFGRDIDDDENAQFALTNGSGEVSVRLISGRVPGTLSLRAVAFHNRQIDWDRSRPLVIRGGIPSARGFDLDCEHQIIPAFSHREYDEENEVQHYLMGNEEGTHCEVQVADQVTGRIDRDHRVYFITEAGTVNQENGLDDRGRAETLLRVGDPPPRDVEPMEYEDEYSYEHSDLIFNPRDGLVRVVAFTRGEEDFIDMNGNEIWDRNIDRQEPAHMLAEPYVDANDNGTRDPDEEFRDSDGDGVWYDPNPNTHQWRSSTDIWTSTTVLWTGNLQTGLERDGLSIEVCDPGDGCWEIGAQGAPFQCLDPTRNLTRADLTFDVGGGARLIGKFVDDNGNCLGGRGQGRVTITPPTDMAILNDFLTRGLEGQYCWAGFERPRGRIFVWELVDATQEPQDDSRVDTLTVDLSYQSLNGVQRQIQYNWSVCR